MSIVAGVALTAVVISAGVFLYLNLGTGQTTQAGTDRPPTSRSDSTGRGIPADKADADARALSFSLLDTSGGVVMQQAAVAGEAPVEVNLPQLPAGLYVMSVKGMQAQTQRFTVKLAVDKRYANR